MTREPRVSVIIPTHNCGAYIGDAIESVVAQTYAEYEIIVVDDGSTDDTKTALAPYVGRIHYLCQNNRGVSAARNAGIARARGEVVAFLDADDMWLPLKLELQLEALQGHPDVALCFTDFLEFDKSGVTMPSRMNTRANARAWFERYRVGNSEVACGPMYEDLLQANWIHTSSVVIRRATFLRVGVFDEAFGVGEDYDVWLRIARTYPLVCVNRVLSGYRYQAQSVCGPPESRRLVYSRCVAQVLEKHLRENAVPSALRDVAAEKVSQCYWELGWSLFRQNRPSEARSLFWQGFRYHPSRRLLWLYLGASFLPLPIIEAIRRMKHWGRAFQDRPETAQR